jgi:hypothetical protein
MITQPHATLQNRSQEALVNLETQKRKIEAILSNLRAYQKMKPSQRQAQSIRDNERTLEDIKAGIARLDRAT